MAEPQRQLAELEPVESDVRHYHEPVSPHGDFHPSSVVLVIIAIVALVLLLVGVVVDRSDLEFAGAIFLKVVLVVLIVGTPAIPNLVK